MRLNLQAKVRIAPSGILRTIHQQVFHLKVITGQLILGFPFETITGEKERNLLMKQVLKFFEE